eukprot:jgi/Mesvir1/3437/Mv11933-RA.2
MPHHRSAQYLLSLCLALPLPCPACLQLPNSQDFGRLTTHEVLSDLTELCGCATGECCSVDQLSRIKQIHPPKGRWLTVLYAHGLSGLPPVFQDIGDRRMHITQASLNRHMAQLLNGYLELTKMRHPSLQRGHRVWAGYGFRAGARILLTLLVHGVDKPSIVGFDVKREDNLLYSGRSSHTGDEYKHLIETLVLHELVRADLVINLDAREASPGAKAAAGGQQRGSAPVTPALDMAASPQRASDWAQRSDATVGMGGPGMGVGGQAGVGARVQPGLGVGLQQISGGKVLPGLGVGGHPGLGAGGQPGSGPGMPLGLGGQVQPGMGLGPQPGMGVGPSLDHTRPGTGAGGLPGTGVGIRGGMGVAQPGPSPSDYTGSLWVPAERSAAATATGATRAGPPTIQAWPGGRGGAAGPVGDPVPRMGAYTPGQDPDSDPYKSFWGLMGSTPTAGAGPVAAGGNVARPPTTGLVIGGSIRHVVDLPDTLDLSPGEAGGDVGLVGAGRGDTVAADLRRTWQQTWSTLSTPQGAAVLLPGAAATQPGSMAGGGPAPLPDYGYGGEAGYGGTGNKEVDYAGEEDMGVDYGEDDRVALMDEGLTPVPASAELGTAPGRLLDTTPMSVLGGNTPTVLGGATPTPLGAATPTVLGRTTPTGLGWTAPTVLGSAPAATWLEGTSEPHLRASGPSPFGLAGKGEEPVPGQASALTRTGWQGRGEDGGQASGVSSPQAEGGGEVAGGTGGAFSTSLQGSSKEAVAASRLSNTRAEGRVEEGGKSRGQGGLFEGTSTVGGEASAPAGVATGGKESEEPRVDLSPREGGRDAGLVGAGRGDTVAGAARATPRGAAALLPGAAATQPGSMAGGGGATLPDYGYGGEAGYGGTGNEEVDYVGEEDVGVDHGEDDRVVPMDEGLKPVSASAELGMAPSRLLDTTPMSVLGATSPTVSGKTTPTPLGRTTPTGLGWTAPTVLGAAPAATWLEGTSEPHLRASGPSRFGLAGKGEEPVPGQASALTHTGWEGSGEDRGEVSGVSSPQAEGSGTVAGGASGAFSTRLQGGASGAFSTRLQGGEEVVAASGLSSTRAEGRVEEGGESRGQGGLFEGTARVGGGASVLSSTEVATSGKEREDSRVPGLLIDGVGEEVGRAGGLSSTPLEGRADESGRILEGAPTELEGGSAVQGGGAGGERPSWLESRGPAQDDASEADGSQAPGESVDSAAATDEVDSKVSDVDIRQVLEGSRDARGPLSEGMASVGEGGTATEEGTISLTAALLGGSEQAAGEGHGEGFRPAALEFDGDEPAPIRAPGLDGEGRGMPPAQFEGSGGQGGQAGGPGDLSKGTGEEVGEAIGRFSEQLRAWGEEAGGGSPGKSLSPGSQGEQARRAMEVSPTRKEGSGGLQGGEASGQVPSGLEGSGAQGGMASGRSPPRKLRRSKALDESKGVPKLLYWKGAAIYNGHKPWQATPAAPATPDAPA